jgi:redox-sensitive bicupin YhaK (pirin superfamily)
VITLRRGVDRNFDLDGRDGGSQRHPDSTIATRFGSLEHLTESRMAPGSRVIRRAADGADIVTYVREGSVAFDDHLGHRGTLNAGEFRRLTVQSDTRLVELNLSLCETAQLFLIWLRPSPESADLGCEQRRFTVAQRRGLRCLVASSDGRSGSLCLRQDARIYSAVLRRGQHVVHELVQSHRAWIHVVQGHVSIGGLALTSGDAAGVTHQRAASLTALDDSEILLVDVGPPRQPIATLHDDANSAQRPHLG